MRNGIYSHSEARTIDEGLRSYMLKVYNFMAGGLCLTGLAAWLIANTSLLKVFFEISENSFLTRFSGESYKLINECFLLLFC